MNNPIKFLFFSFSYFCLIFNALAQDIKIELGKTEITENENFLITISIQDERISKYSSFPDIPGFIKQGTSSSKTTSNINGGLTSFEKITQNYKPTRKGTFVITPFTMQINGLEVQSMGATLKVVESGGSTAQKSDPFSDFWGNKKQTEFVDIQEDAFFAITTNKKNVYVGEGFTMSISFYISLKNRARMEFDKISDQLGEILKKVKPQNCWEESFGIDKINPEYVTINKKQYTQYRMYQATFFPLNAEDISIPSAGLRMIKYKMAKNPSFFGRNMQEDYKTFYSKATKVRVKKLPPHPLSNSVSVGQFKLIENIEAKMLKTGQSYNYQFSISGKGNISAVNEMEIPAQETFDFFPPVVTTNLNKTNNTITGSKNFSYKIQPKEPGEYQLKEYFSWVYFNPVQAKYDTLQSQILLLVTGESKKNAEIAANNSGGFYDKLSSTDNSISSLGNKDWVYISFNLSLVLILVVSAIVIWKKPV